MVGFGKSPWKVTILLVAVAAGSLGLRGPVIIQPVAAAAEEPAAALPKSAHVASPEEETVAVRGTVVDESGGPVEGAVVSVRHHAQTKASVRSAADGSFTLDVPRRSYDGVLLLASDEPADRLGTAVHPDEAAKDDQSVRIVVHRAHKLDVTVTDDQGLLVTGARVAAIYRQQPLAEQLSDEGGRVVMRVPAEKQLLVYAVKRDVGLDYVRMTPDREESLTLALRNTVPVRVRVVDAQERPIAGAKVYPVSVGRLHEGVFSFWLMGIGEFHVTTDETGVATCRIPIDNIYHVPIQVEAEGYVRPAWVYWVPDEAVTGVRTGMQVPGGRAVGGGEFIVNLQPAVVIRGTVMNADGRPAAGASVGVFGKGYDKSSFVQGTKCDADGEFKLALTPGLYYVFNAEALGERSRDQKLVIVADRPPPPLKIVLQAARRIHGTITRGSERTPAAWQHLSVLWRDDESYSKQPPEERLPNPTNEPGPIVLGITSNGRTDGQGRFEFFVPPGRYYVVGSGKFRDPSIWRDDGPLLPQVDVSERSEARIDIHSDDPR